MTLDIQMKEGHYRKNGLPDDVDITIGEWVTVLNKKGITDEDIIQHFLSFGTIDGVCEVVDIDDK